MDNASLKNYDVFLQKETGQLWQYMERTDFHSGTKNDYIRDVKTGEEESGWTIKIKLQTLEYEFIGNFPEFNIETLELLYGQR